MTRRLKERRADVHRRIGELRAELQLLEARADEIEQLWNELVDEQTIDNAILSGTYISEPSIAMGGKASAGELILRAMRDLEEAGYEYAQRKAIFDVIARTGHQFKSNTLRVALRRLVETGRVQQIGNLYCLVRETEAAASDKAAA